MACVLGRPGPQIGSSIGGLMLPRIPTNKVRYHRDHQNTFFSTDFCLLVKSDFFFGERLLLERLSDLSIEFADRDK